MGPGSRLDKLLQDVKEVKYMLMELVVWVNDLISELKDLEHLPRDRSIVFFHRRCGLITSLEPLAKKLEEMGFELREGDRLVWGVEKGKRGQPIIRARIRKKK